MDMDISGSQFGGGLAVSMNSALGNPSASTTNNPAALPNMAAAFTGFPADFSMFLQNSEQLQMFARAQQQFHFHQQMQLAAQAHLNNQKLSSSSSSGATASATVTSPSDNSHNEECDTSYGTNASNSSPINHAFKTMAAATTTSANSPLRNTSINNVKLESDLLVNYANSSPLATDSGIHCDDMEEDDSASVMSARRSSIDRKPVVRNLLPSSSPLHRSNHLMTSPISPAASAAMDSYHHHYNNQHLHRSSSSSHSSPSPTLSIHHHHQQHKSPLSTNSSATSPLNILAPPTPELTSPLSQHPSQGLLAIKPQITSPALSSAVSPPVSNINSVTANSVAMAAAAAAAMAGGSHGSFLANQIAAAAMVAQQHGGGHPMDPVSMAMNPLLGHKHPLEQLDTLQSSNHAIARALSLGSSQQRRPRSEKKLIPDDLKDQKYFERRKRNNQAAKKSRDSRKNREDDVSMRANYLEKENAILRAQVSTLREEANSLRHLMLQKRSRNGH